MCTPEQAKRMFANAERITLSPEAFDRVVELCEEPANPTPALIALFRDRKTGRANSATPAQN